MAIKSRRNLLNKQKRSRNQQKIEGLVVYSCLAEATL